MVSELPNNIEAEQGLLGAIFVRNEVFYDASSVVKADDFYYPIHGEIFMKCHEMIEQGKTVGPIALKAFFQEREDLPNPDYLVDLAAVAFATNIMGYANIVAELAERRRLIEIVENARELLRNPEASATEIRADIATQIETFAKSTFVKTKSQVAMEAVEAIKLPPQCHSTGLRSLDNAMAGGLYAGFTYGLCGAAKRGKTTFAHTISQNLNDRGVDHAYIALEMGSQQIEQRNMARSLGVNSLAFLRKEKDPELMKRLANQATTLRDHTLYLDMPGCSFSQIRAELSRLVAKKKIKGFILDYWQLVGGGEKNQTKADFLYEVAQWCANFARKHKIWCIILSQLNRENQVFGSAGLEKACDQLYFIEKIETNSIIEELWLSMKHTRYTPLCDVGGENQAAFFINQKSGPYIEELNK